MEIAWDNAASEISHLLQNYYILFVFLKDLKKFSSKENKIFNW